MFLIILSWSKDNLCISVLSKMYLLVEFIDEKNLAVIPDSWLDGNSCALWPSWKNPTKLTNAVKKNVPPSEDWKAFPIKEIYRNGMIIIVVLQN